ncbi:MAG: hypothetical protein AMXMBFR33_04680 [Candidatus Xenobia bacterium]
MGGQNVSPVRRILAVVVLALLIAAPEALGRKPSLYLEVDRYALAAPASAERSLDALGAYLKKAGQTSEERSRAVYRWITEHIAYDTVSYFSGQYPDQSAEAVLKRRTGVCAGYANLYEALASRCAVETVVVSGEVRRDPEDTTNLSLGHAWNAVRIQGRWYLLDSTWGSGYVDYQSRRFTRKFNPYYFLVPPDQLIYSHFPKEKTWQLLSPPRSRAQVDSLPRVGSACFRFDIRPRESRGTLKTDQGLKLKFRAASGVSLMAGLYRNGQELPDSHCLAQVDKDGWAVDVLFPAPGRYKVAIFGKDDPFAERFNYVMEYWVEARRGTTQRFPEISSTFLERKAMLEYPRTLALPPGKKSAFSVYVPAASDVQIINGGKWHPLSRQGQWFRGQAALETGEAKVSARFPGNDQYWTLLRYRVDQAVTHRFPGPLDRILEPMLLGDLAHEASVGEAIGQLEIDRRQGDVPDR